jgi:hypothetical protein
MPYTHTTLGVFREQLAARLGDPSKLFWGDHELNLYIAEALRCWQAITKSYRKQVLMSTQPNVVWYDIRAQIPEFYLGVLSRDLIGTIQYHLLEPFSPGVWTGTGQFTLDKLTAATQRRRDQFLLETGMIVSRDIEFLPPPPATRIILGDRTLDVRRVSVFNAAGDFSQLARGNEEEWRDYLPQWSTTPDVPLAYSVVATDPTTIQVAPPPVDAYAASLLMINAPPPVNPASNDPFGVPDDFCWVVKWGALADLLGVDGDAADPGRAAYCENRWQDGIELAKQASSIIYAEINGHSAELETVDAMDAYQGGWEAEPRGAPSRIAMAGWNEMALCDPPPDNGFYSLLLSVVPQFPVPFSDADFIRVSREHLDVILDYAEHLAAFKMGANEVKGTQSQYERFRRAASVQLNRFTSMGNRVDRMLGKAQEERIDRPSGAEVPANG